MPHHPSEPEDERDQLAASTEAERLAPTPPVPEAGPARGGLRGATIDLGPLRRHREFRLLWIGQGVSLLGSTITYTALPFQAYHLTGSSLVVGLLGVVELVPLLLSALVGGAVADAVDRRRMVLLTEAGFAVCTGLLVVNAALPHPAVWPLFALSAAMAAMDGFQRPSLDALVPRLVPRDEIAAANALTSFRMTIGTVAGPAIGGVLIAAVGLAATYGVDVASFAVSLGALALMHAVPPPAEAEPPSLRRIREGWQYARSRQELLGTYTVDMAAMFFGMPEALFPAVASRLGGPRVLGLLYAAPAAGALVATLLSGRVGRVHRHGVGVCVAAAMWGVGIVGVRARAGPAACARGPRRRRRRRHGQRALPEHDLEPDHPRPSARPAGRNRAGQLLDRPAPGQRGGGRGGCDLVGADVDRVGRGAVRGRCGRGGRAPARVLALRRTRASPGRRVCLNPEPMASRTRRPTLAALLRSGEPRDRDRVAVEVEGRELVLSNLDKVLYPGSGVHQGRRDRLLPAGSLPVMLAPPTAAIRSR